MTWTKLHDGWNRDPKIVGLPRDARLFWVDSLTYCNEQLTDGFISEDVLAHVSPGESLKSIRSWVQKLVERGLFTHDSKRLGWKIHKFLKWNWSKKRVLENRSKEATKKAEARAKKKAVPKDVPQGTLEGHSKDSPGESRLPIRSGSDPIRSKEKIQIPLPSGEGTVAVAPSHDAANDEQDQNYNETVQASLFDPGPQAVKPKVVQQRRLPLKAGLKPEPFWLIWRKLWGEKYNAAYTESDGDGAKMQTAAKKAQSAAHLHKSGDPAAPLEVFEYWVRSYLGDPGRRDFLAHHCHPLRNLMHDLSRYGTPWSAPESREQAAGDYEPLPRVHRDPDWQPTEDKKRAEALRDGPKEGEAF